jgi:hypothetical protein
LGVIDVAVEFAILPTAVLSVLQGLLYPLSDLSSIH